ncbi:hypothetical protein E0Z10_g9869 [Xylaria hypoxylon]|uniref:AB hydrolase-1 domain-containing protein n=1 Tax=Xylaria hypoxylon TaxID=37992 RepID=A0A4Z0YMK3_9PEZI|nr:hypothetical protein E0Z10_g9869 [Xylaria hypoxylon]
MAYREMQQLELGSKVRLPPKRPNLQLWPTWWYAANLVALALFATGFVLYQLRENDGIAPLSTVSHKSQTSSRGSQQQAYAQEWSTIEPSRDLLWHSCYNGAYDCARLDVQMDWLDPSDEERVVLAIIRLRATEQDDYRGPVIFNPGGPGGSGVFSLIDHGASLQTIIGRNHDLISFDPRGIGATLPRIECWDTAEQRQLWDLQDVLVGVVDAHPGTIYDVYARAAAFSSACEAHMTGKSNILRHVGTASHARDMLEILHKLGQDKLKYWGFSYGTVIGGVFAAMYPDKVERLVSDGNVDIREWHYQTHINFLRDTDKVMNAFYDFCFKAGPGGCDLYADTPELIRQRIENLLEKIRKHPILVIADGSFPTIGPNMPQLITWSHIRRLTSAALYRPIFLFKKYATVMAALETGDGRPFYSLNNNLYSSQGPPPSICSVETLPPGVPRLEEGNNEAFPAIMCSDLPPINQTVEEFVDFAQQLSEISKSAGDVNALFRLACIGRTIRPKWRFDGPFEGNTSFPILYVNNIADNVAPLVSATNNSQGFPGSVILVQNSYGHTSLSAASTCTATYIRDYFQHGKLPKPETTCDPDIYPFQDTSPKSEDELAVSINALLKANWGFAPRWNI